MSDRKVTTVDTEGKNIEACLTEDDDGEAVIAITETYGQCEFFLYPQQCKFFGSALKMLARIAERESEEMNHV